MKVRNIAFFGVMASILSVGYANAADATVIASKAYADTKQTKIDGSHNGQVVVGTSTAGTVSFKAIDTSVTSGSSNLVTSGAVSTAIGSANTAVTNAYGDNALNSDGLAATDNLAKVATLQKTIATQGSATKDWLDVTNDDAGTSVNLVTAKTKQDEYVPTVAAIEKRLEKKQNALTFDNTPTSGSNNPVKSGGVYTQLQGKQANLGGSGNDGKAVIASGTAGTVNYRTISTTKPTSTTSTDLVTAGAVATGLADKVTANSAITASGTTNKFVQYDTKGLVTAGVDAKYKNIDSVLYDINSGSAATCSAANPCVLSYIGDGKYKWTNMDIDGLTVNTAAN